MKRLHTIAGFIVLLACNILAENIQLRGFIVTKQCLEKSAFAECPLKQLTLLSDTNPLLLFTPGDSRIYELNISKLPKSQLDKSVFRNNARVTGELEEGTNCITVERVEEPPPPQKSFFKGSFVGGSGGSVKSPSVKPKSIGFSTGGAKDIDNFRENLKAEYLPLPESVTYEGLFYDYYFDLFAAGECKELFCPVYAKALSPDPFSGENEHYLSVGLDSGITDFKRPPINLVVVLDYSGSMGSNFNKYYYDGNGNRMHTDDMRSKMALANEAIVNITRHLGPDDRFGLVLYDNYAFVDIPIEPMKNFKRPALEKALLTTYPKGGTNMEAGITLGVEQFNKALLNDRAYENRIIFITDAMPNRGATSESGLLGLGKKAAEKGIYTTFVGVGVDFNTQLVEAITKMQGANYYFIQSKEDFEKRMNAEFDFMVTPLVFDLNLFVESHGFEIETVYGSPEADLANGQLMQVKTLFPSAKSENAVKGGVVLLKLKKLSDSKDKELVLRVSYKDRKGKTYFSHKRVALQETMPHYDSSGIRKAVLLSRYAGLLKNWMIDQRQQCNRIPGPYDYWRQGIPLPMYRLGRWERRSCQIMPSEGYAKIFSYFEKYFEVEKGIIGDETLQQEVEILKELAQRK